MRTFYRYDAYPVAPVNNLAEYLFIPPVQHVHSICGCRRCSRPHQQHFVAYTFFIRTNQACKPLETSRESQCRERPWYFGTPTLIQHLHAKRIALHASRYEREKENRDGGRSFQLRYRAFELVRRARHRSQDLALRYVGDADETWGHPRSIAIVPTVQDGADAAVGPPPR